MIIDLISDLHGHFPQLEGGDLLIVAGDLTKTDTYDEHEGFIHWLRNQDYKRKILVAGNHDNLYLDIDPASDDHPEVGPFPHIISDWNEFSISYLCDSGCEFEGLKIWGSPWTQTFVGMNPKCKAFTLDTEEELAEKWLTCPNDVDIIVTHCPPYDILDETTEGIKTGSPSLLKLICEKKPILSIFGHIHEQGSKSIDLGFTLCINASHVNERYEPKNKAVRIELDSKNKRKIRLN